MWSYFLQKKGGKILNLWIHFFIIIETNKSIKITFIVVFVFISHTRPRKVNFVLKKKYKLWINKNELLLIINVEKTIPNIVWTEQYIEYILSTKCAFQL